MRGTGGEGEGSVTTLGVAADCLFNNRVLSSIQTGI